MSPADRASAESALRTLALTAGATVIETPAGTIIVLTKRAAADPDELLPLPKAVVANNSRSGHAACRR